MKKGEQYGATSLPEHTHCTGHESRLHRNLSGRFGDAAYGAQVLIAELAAAYLCAALAILGRQRHAEYLGNWVKLLGEDKRAIFPGSSKATEEAQFLERMGGMAPVEEAQEAA